VQCERCEHHLQVACQQSAVINVLIYIDIISEGILDALFWCISGHQSHHSVSSVVLSLQGLLQILGSTFMTEPGKSA
jgi:hypothetical protein